VVPIELIQDFYPEKEAVFAPVGDFRKINYKAVFPTAIATFSNSDLLQVEIEDDNLLRYDDETGYFETLKAGNTVAYISYRGIKKYVFFEIVNPTLLDTDEKVIKTFGLDSAAGNSNLAAVVSNKTAKPVVELFVMSHCPFGTQMEKGILPVVDLLGDKIDFEIKFNDYAMHGEKELVEQLNQYCIQKEQPAKFNDYLSCFLGSSDSAACLTEANINQKTLDACYSKTDKEFKVMDNFKNNVGYQGSYPGFDIYASDNAKYNVGGSPTLVINEQATQSGRDSASLLTKICSAFTSIPDECSTVLSSLAPSTGFGY